MRATTVLCRINRLLELTLLIVVTGMRMLEADKREPVGRVVIEVVKILFFLYLFLLSITLMGSALKMSGKEFSDSLMHATSNPFVALIIGIVSTSIIQSSSTTTTIIVTMVAAGTLPLRSAIPMVMGANIGTTVTNTIVSFGYVGRKTEFERSFGASIVHDMFNIYATLILFPLEIFFSPIYHSARVLEKVFEGLGGFKFSSPLHALLEPVAEPITAFIGNHWIILILAFAGLVMAMTGMVKYLRGVIMEKVELVLNKYLFKNMFVSLGFGLVLTAVVQSSSITTSIIIPLVGAGVLNIEQIFPYTLGANVGTTVTALLAVLALSSGKEAAMTIALCHLLFNVYGILILLPLKVIPIKTATFIASIVSRSKKHFFAFLVIYILLHIAPILFATLD